MPKARKKKSCRRCKKKRDIDEFAYSAHTADKKRHVCSTCVGNKMRESHASRKAGMAKARRAAAEVHRANGAHVTLANAALKQANSFVKQVTKLVNTEVKRLRETLAAEDIALDSVQFEGQRCTVVYRRTETFEL
jgi:superfamily II helicase